MKFLYGLLGTAVVCSASHNVDYDKFPGTRAGADVCSQALLLHFSCLSAATYEAGKSVAREIARVVIESEELTAHMTITPGEGPVCGEDDQVKAQALLDSMSVSDRSYCQEFFAVSPEYSVLSKHTYGGPK